MVPRGSYIRQDRTRGCLLLLSLRGGWCPARDGAAAESHLVLVVMTRVGGSTGALLLLLLWGLL